MKPVEQTLTLIFRIGTGIAFVILIAAVLVQVVGRTLGSSPVWTEELTRFALLYMVAFGAGLSLLTRELVNVDVVCDSLPGAWPRRLQMVSSVGLVGLAATLVWPSWRFTSIGQMQTSPALGLRMDFAHGTILILLLSLAIFAVLRLAKLFKGPENEAAASHGETD